MPCTRPAFSARSASAMAPISTGAKYRDCLNAPATLAAAAPGCSMTSATGTSVASSDTPYPKRSSRTTGMIKAMAMLLGSRRNW